MSECGPVVQTGGRKAKYTDKNKLFHCWLYLCNGDIRGVSGDEVGEERRERT
jgi:hypothetical protein